MKPRAISKVLICMMFIIKLITSPALAHKDGLRTLVLVTAISNKFNKLKPVMFRKIFLNVPVAIKTEQLFPIINTSNDLLYEVFLQKVVYMSERHYDRLLISKTFRTGRPRPEFYSDNTTLINALNSTPGSISFMWEEIAKKEKSIRILQTIWKERH